MARGGSRGGRTLLFGKSKFGWWERSRERVRMGEELKAVRKLRTFSVPAPRRERVWSREKVRMGRRKGDGKVSFQRVKLSNVLEMAPNAAQSPGEGQV